MHLETKNSETSSAATSPVAWIEGIGLLGPGLANWPQAQQVLNGAEAYQPARTVLPAPTLLPAAERRRAVAMVKATLAAGLEACAMAQRDPATLATVFTSSSGDGQNMHAICETLASEQREISPTRFHNSVHNAAAGYWSIATGATPASTALCAYDGSFAAGLLEALAWLATERSPILLLAYDVDYPEPLRSLRPVTDALCVALLLTPERGEHARARIDLQLATPGSNQPTRVGLPALEALRHSIPAARALPLLEALALRRNGAVTLDYLDDCAMTVNVQHV
jgi:hypothetical protein